jgi:methionyl-tRNA formyltransferase
MRLIFAGTPEFAALALGAIVAAGHEVALVLTLLAVKFDVWFVTVKLSIAVE